MAKYGDGDLQTFASKVSIDRSTVSQLYHDHREVTDKYAIRISNRLHIDPPKDMALQPVAQPEPPAAPAQPTEREAQLVDMVNRLLTTNDQLLTRLGTMERVMQSLWDEVRANRGDLGKLPAEVARAMKSVSR